MLVGTLQVNPLGTNLGAAPAYLAHEMYHSKMDKTRFVVSFLECNATLRNIPKVRRRRALIHDLFKWKHARRTHECF